VALFIPVFSMTTGQTVPLWPSLKDWAWIAVLAWGCTVYPFTMANVLLRKISPFTVSLALNLEPIYGILLAVLFFGNSEHMNTGFYVGASLMLLAVMAYPFLDKTPQQS
jgi:drug/metabolite transporter (DMT)-like permease